MTPEQIIVVLGVAVVVLGVWIIRLMRSESRIVKNFEQLYDDRNDWMALSRERLDLYVAKNAEAVQWQSRCETLSEANAILIRDRDRAQAQVAELTIERDEADQSAHHAYERLRALEHERHESFAEKHDRVGVDSL